jgi:hypothetical protein
MTQRAAVLEVWNTIGIGEEFNLDVFEKLVDKLLNAYNKGIRRCSLTAMMRTLRNEHKYGINGHEHTFKFEVVNSGKGLYKKIS